MTNLEQSIYNTWLAVTRSQQGKPFKLRKNWNNFTSNPDYLYIKKLAKMFNRYDNINIDDWFRAPYVVYPEKIQYDLKHYTVMKQYNIYRLYMQKKNDTKYTPEEFHNTLFKNKKQKS